MALCIFYFNSCSSKKILILPYVRGVSERIEKLANHLGMKTVFKSRNTLRQSLLRVMNPTPKDDCDHVYIGETGRTLRKRLKEHDYAVGTSDTNNGIAVHAWTNSHKVNWEATRVRLVEHSPKRGKYWKPS